jgi:hypothetical protein
VARIYVRDSSSEARVVLGHALSRGYRGIPAEALITGSVAPPSRRTRQRK